MGVFQVGSISWRWKDVPRILLEYLIITAGALLVALAADVFLIPNQVVSGGITGVAIILYYLLGTPVGIVTLLLNIPLFIAGVRWGGGLTTGIRTVYAVIIMSFFIDFLQGRVPAVTRDPLLYTVYGGIIDGLGLGLVLRFRGTTGGTDIIARLAKRFLGLNYGFTLLITNVIVLGAAAFIFGVEPAMYAIILAAISSKVIDLVQEGIQSTRAVIIVSNHPDKVREAILRELERGVTVLEGRGGYTGARREVLLCAVQRNEISRLKYILHQVDPEAFVIINAAHEVLGEGFQDIRLSEL
ncbi:MAG: YitT family protein [Anaerolineae bacterium]